MVNETIAATTEAELRERLEQSGVLVEGWGTGKAKSLAHLIKEIVSGETMLLDRDGALVRQVSVAQADITFRGPEGLLKLVELRQVFTDGRVRERNNAFSLAEKMEPGEDPAQAIERGIREELGVEGDLPIQFVGEECEGMFSPSYPGLFSEYRFFRYTVEFWADQYRPEGYIETQPDKTTYFGWQPA